MLILHNLYHMSMKQVLLLSMWLKENASSPRSTTSKWWRWDMNPDVADLKDWPLSIHQGTLENLDVNSLSSNVSLNVCWYSRGPIIHPTGSIISSIAAQCDFGVLIDRGFFWESRLHRVAGVPSSIHESFVPVYKLRYFLGVLRAGWGDSRA